RPRRARRPRPALRPPHRPRLRGRRRRSRPSRRLLLLVQGSWIDRHADRDIQLLVYRLAGPLGPDMEAPRLPGLERRLADLDIAFDHVREALPLPILQLAKLRRGRLGLGADVVVAGLPV